MKKTFLLFLFAFICSLPSYSQVNLQIGYGMGYTNPRDMNKVIYLYNQLHYNLDKTMPKIHFTHGYVIGVSFGTRLKFEIHRTSRRALVTAEQGDTVRQFRFITNSINFGLSWGPNPKWDFGGSVDIGNFKGFGRIGPKDDKPKFERYFVIDNSILLRSQVGLTVFAQRNFGHLSARLYYQFQPFTRSLDIMDTRLLGGSIVAFDHLQSKASNLGLEIMFRIGNVKD